MPKHPDHQPTRLWKLMRLLIASSSQHAFLDRRWIPWLFAVTPRGWQTPLALRLLSLSPHYWVYQWTHLYAGRPRNQVLLAEYERNAQSRREICDKLLRPLLRKDMHVMDFGCGPGFLAKAVSSHVATITASDVSRGVVACAQCLNAAPNLTYRVNSFDRLNGIHNDSLDLVYSFAVFQHLLKEQAEAFLREFLRVLRPGGQVACHMILKEPGQPRAADPSQGGWLKQRTHLRMVYFTPAEAVELFRRVGFENVGVSQVNSIAKLNDDIGREQLVTGFRPANAARRPQSRAAA